MTTVSPVLERYQPCDLCQEEWEQARTSAIDLVVAAIPEPVSSARSALSILARFLAWHPLWDRLSAPDYVVLLAPVHISTFVASDARHRNAGSALRRLARAAGATPPRQVIASKPASRPATAFWRAVAGNGPLTALVEARRRSGRAFTPRSLAGVAAELIEGAPDLEFLVKGCGSLDDDGTVAALHDVARTLRSMSARARGEVSLPRRSARTEREPAKGLSRRAVVRAAREAQRRREEASAVAASASVRLDAVETSQNPVIESAIADFHPYRFSEAEWDLVREATCALLRAYEPPSVTWVQSQAGVVSRFCRFVANRSERADRGAPLELTEALAPGLIEEYLAGPLANTPDSTRATVRSTLRRATRNLSAAPSGSIAYHPVNPPYSAAECAELFRLARFQPTATMRRGMSALVGLGLGAGLSASEQRGISPEHVSEIVVDGVATLVVDVKGERARRVVVRAPYDELVRDALRLHREQGRGRQNPLYGSKPDRHNATGVVTSNAHSAIGMGVELDPARLRSTWLVAAMCADLPLGVLLRVSGLRSARTLVDLLAYCPAPDEEAVLAALRLVGGTASDDAGTAS